MLMRLVERLAPAIGTVRRDGAVVPSATVRLWAINRWLRWTGWRVVVGYDPEHKSATRIGVVWWGFAFVGHEPFAHDPEDT